MSQVYGDSIQYTVTPTISSSTSAYAADDILGGIQTLPVGDGGRKAGGVLLQHLAVVDKSLEKTGMDIVFFSGSPTIAADNSAQAWTAANMASLCVGSVSLSSTSYYSAGTVAVINAENIGMYIVPEASSTVYAAVVLKSATTYAGTGDVVFKYSFYRDK